MRCRNVSVLCSSTCWWRSVSVRRPGRCWAVSTGGWVTAEGVLHMLLVALWLHFGALFGRCVTVRWVALTRWTVPITGVRRKVCVLNCWSNKPCGRVVIGKCVEG